MEVDRAAVEAAVRTLREHEIQGVCADAGSRATRGIGSHERAALGVTLGDFR